MHTVLPAVSDDSSAVDRITREISQFTAEERDCVSELWQNYLENGNESPYRFCVAKDLETNGIQGFACYGKHALTKSTYDLYWIAVDPLIQRSGVGSALLHFVEQQVAKNPDSRLIVETSSTPAYSGARSFYQNNNYRRSAVLRNFYAPGDHLVIYSKSFQVPVAVKTGAQVRENQETMPDFQLRWGENKWF